MNAGRDPDDTRQRPAGTEGGRTLWQARWFRTVVVLSLAVGSAISIVPYALQAAADREAGASVPAAPVTAEARPAKAAREPSSAKPVAEARPSTGADDLYGVQVGADRDARLARRVADRLRGDRYPVHESVTTRSPSGTETATVTLPTSAPGGRDRYEVVVSGASANDAGAKLSAKGLASQPSAEGTVITPSLPLGEAVALSKDLSAGGLVVRVRRVETSGHPVRPPGGGGGANALHRVRVGGFVDRAAALAVLKELESRGYQPFLTRGNE